MDLPQIGLGTFLLETVTENVLAAIRMGYRHIDTAHGYGNEVEIGKAIKQSGIKRQELFITSKLWGTDHFRVQEAAQESLDALETYIDLFLIHWPIAMRSSTEHFPKKDGKIDIVPTDLIRTWKEMESLVQQKKVRFIGVSNFNSQQLKLILENCSIKPYANQIELHPYCYPKNLITFCIINQIKIIAYSSLGASSCEYNKDNTLIQVANTYGLTIEQLLLSWAISKGFYVIPKTNSPLRMKSNFEIKHIDTAQIDVLHLNKQMRVFDPLNLFGVEVKYD